MCRFIIQLKLLDKSSLLILRWSYWRYRWLWFLLSYSWIASGYILRCCMEWLVPCMPGVLWLACMSRLLAFDFWCYMRSPKVFLTITLSRSHCVRLLCLQKGELRCLLPRSLLANGFFGARSGEENDNKKNTSPCSCSWSGQRKIPSYINKIVFPQEFLSTLRTIAMQEHELEQVASLLGEVCTSSLYFSQVLTHKTMISAFNFCLKASCCIYHMRWWYYSFLFTV
jgi:hypothetical protein